jgi:hypothetical protein
MFGRNKVFQIHMARKFPLLIILCISTICICFGGNDSLSVSNSSKGQLKNGLYINLGVAFPSMSTVFNGYTFNTNTLGVQPNIELGYQWYAIRKNNWGAGLRISWIQFGYSAYQPNYVYTNLTGNPELAQGGVGDLRILKVIPQFTYLLKNDMAFDISFEVAPTLYWGNETSSSITNHYSGLGALFAPGLRFRFQRFALGTDIGFGTLKGNFYWHDGSNSTNYNAKFAIFSPRFYMGMQF